LSFHKNLSSPEKLAMCPSSPPTNPAASNIGEYLPPVDLDEAYENRKYIPGGDAYVDQWNAAAADFRNSVPHSDLDQSYGDAPRQKYDLFWPEGGPGTEKGLLVIVHGGYWVAFSKDNFTHLAAGPRDLGWAVAMVSYTLAPEARISAITTEISHAVNHLAKIGRGPMRLAGHSAGGHLVSRMMCRDIALGDIAAARIDRVVSISGLHDLRPLRLLEKNAEFQLDEAEAMRESAIACLPRGGINLVCVAGADERPEFVRQNGLLPLIWQGLGVKGAAHLIDDENHFSIIGQMTDSKSQLCGLIDSDLS
jgi:arylformamidase